MLNANLAKLGLRVVSAALIVAAVAVGMTRPRSIASAKMSAVAAAVEAQVYKLPMRFEPNLGQSDPRVQFISRGSGYALFLTKNEAVLALRAHAVTKQSAKPLAGGAVFRIKLRDANPSPRIEGLEPLASSSNYFVGSDPKQWHSSIPNYSRVVYRDVYRGIGLVYHGDGQQLEYDFVVAPGIDPRQIRLSVAGADQLRIDDNGQLHMRAGASEIVEHAPIAYQQVGNTLRPVQSRFVHSVDSTIGFQVANYDRELPLTIDPTLVYSTYLGGSGSEDLTGGTGPVAAIAVDSAHNAYVTGSTSSLDFPVTAGALQTSGTSYVTKLNSTGTALVYSTYLGATAYGIAIDSSGDAYVTGTALAGFPTTPGAFQTTNGGAGDAFVCELNSAGSALIYSTYLGGSFNDVAYGIAVDSAGNAYITGLTLSATFPVTAGAFQTTFPGVNNGTVFVSKLNSTGTALLYSTYLGGTNGFIGDHGAAIAVDSTLHAYVTGYATSTNFPITPGAFQTTLAGVQASDAFVTKFNAAGSALAYSTYLGGSGYDFGLGIAIDSSNDAYVTGYTTSPDFPTTSGAVQTADGGGLDGFVSKLNNKGTALIYSTYLGGAKNEEGLAIAVDAYHNAYVTGLTSSSNFPVTSNALQLALVPSVDAFVTKISHDGTTLLYSTYLSGGAGFHHEDFGDGIAVDSSGNIYVTGSTNSTTFPVTTGVLQPVYAGNTDAFVSKIKPPAAP